MESIGKEMEKKLTNMQDLDSPLKMCKNCNTPKVAIIEALGKKFKVPIMCKCEEDKYNQKEKEIKAEEQNYKLRKLKNHSLMSKKFESCTFENFEVDQENKRYFDIAKRYSERFDEAKKENIGLLLHGLPGVGKTHLSFCIANDLINKMVPVIAISSIGLLSRIKETYKRFGSEGDVEIINSLKNASLLILDDLGAENNTPWSKEKLYEIIDSRSRDEKPTIITTNLSLDQLKRRMTGDDGVHRTYDRIIEMCTTIEIKGRPRRVEAAKNKQGLLRDLLK